MFRRQFLPSLPSTIRECYFYKARAFFHILKNAILSVNGGIYISTVVVSKLVMKAGWCLVGWSRKLCRRFGSSKPVLRSYVGHRCIYIKYICVCDYDDEAMSVRANVDAFEKLRPGHRVQLISSQISACCNFGCTSHICSQ